MAESSDHTTYWESPVGWIEITGNAGGISSLLFRDPERDFAPPAGLLAVCTGQLEAYFAGSLKVFDLPLAPLGTEFRLRVWKELINIPYGQVITYRDLAKKVGGTTYTRIVGQANATNPVSILIPCHRVIGMNGSLTGYAGGLWRKKYLLELEQKGNRTDFSPTLFGNIQ